MGLDRRARAWLVRSPDPRDDAACVRAAGDPSPRSVERGGLRRALGAASRRASASVSGAPSTSSTGRRFSSRSSSSSICSARSAAGLGGEPPATITILSGDVHTTYLAEVDLGEKAGPSRVYQVVCSPFRNPLKPFPRRVVKATGSRRSAARLLPLARACGVPPSSATWRYVAPRTYENSIGELELDGRARASRSTGPRARATGASLERAPHA